MPVMIVITDDILDTEIRTNAHVIENEDEFLRNEDEVKQQKWINT